MRSSEIGFFVPKLAKNIAQNKKKSEIVTDYQKFTDVLIKIEHS